MAEMAERPKREHKLPARYLDLEEMTRSRQPRITQKKKKIMRFSNANRAFSEALEAQIYVGECVKVEHPNPNEPWVALVTAIRIDHKCLLFTIF